MRVPKHVDPDKIEQPILERRSYFWPILILPHLPHSHTTAVIGWRGRRPRVLRDVKAAFAGRVRLAETTLSFRHALFPRLFWLQIPLACVDEVRSCELDDGLLVVRYGMDGVVCSGWMWFASRGTSPGKMLLKLDDDKEAWLNALSGIAAREETE